MASRTIFCAAILAALACSLTPAAAQAAPPAPSAPAAPAAPAAQADPEAPAPAAPAPAAPAPAAPAPAAPAPAAPAAQGPAILDEFNLDVYGGADSSRVAAGLSFGNVEPSGMWWSYGGRLSWVHYVNDGPEINGWGLGGTLGIGWDPERLVSPVAGLSVEKTFGTDDLIDFQTQIHAGARVRVTPDPDEYVALTFAVYSSAHFFGKGLPDKSDYGIAVLFSTARFARR